LTEFKNIESIYCNILQYLHKKTPNIGNILVQKIPPNIDDSIINISALLVPPYLLFARVDIGVTEFPTKTAEEEEENSRKRKRKEVGSEFFFQKWACASRFQWGILNLFAAEKITFGGGYNFKTD